MKHSAITLASCIFLCIFLAGCTQQAGPAPVTTQAVQASLPTPAPAESVQAAATTEVPQQVVTIIRQVSQQKDVRDSELLFTFRVPVEWNISTYRITTANDPGMMEYRTTLRDNNIFYIITYTVSRSQDQAYRDQFRKWVPAPAETTVTINNIVYDRFESSSDGRTSVAYVARKGSANERGFASVLVFVADSSHRFEKEDFEGVVSSFRYFSAGAANTTPGQEIERINPPFESYAGLSSGKAGAASAGVSSSGGCSRCGN
ncbi:MULTISPECIES: hypothetical protein [unclassified Methanoregula]|uniref:hypothetical protein n=1 Tax=unclassified Methanoregula TaxID=2649730 RepID=UPI0009CFFFC1|nr:MULTISPECIES: hypothetical protein [unclassified Methanoregula]OPX64417.1 MAG: hypothetical protein A4E33_00998 [Methanoregula sp. PtaB.Bin085]OPY34913.1 MAG: hypothetical protein A4E34_01149 [Methanoregula sp. PtaU1.Bin006]